MILIKSVMKIIPELKIDDRLKVKLIEKCGDAEFRLVEGSDDFVQLEARGLDGILLFQQESMYWLSGYDTFGFCFFQCLYLKADGTMALLTRSADLRQAQHTRYQQSCSAG